MWGGAVPAGKTCRSQGLLEPPWCVHAKFSPCVAPSRQGRGMGSRPQGAIGKVLQHLQMGFLLGGSNLRFHFSEIQEAGVGCGLDTQKRPLSPPSTPKGGGGGEGPTGPGPDLGVHPSPPTRDSCDLTDGNLSPQPLRTVTVLLGATAGAQPPHPSPTQRGSLCPVPPFVGQA